MHAHAEERHPEGGDAVDCAAQEETELVCDLEWQHLKRNDRCNLSERVHELTAPG